MSITSTLSSLSTKLRKASYNGVNFEVSNSNLKFGRRVVVHEYPQQDVPYGEDLGRATRIITMSAFIVGADYASRSKKLIEALEKPVTEPGTLVHPSGKYGLVDAVLGITVSTVPPPVGST